MRVLKFMLIMVLMLIPRSLWAQSSIQIGEMRQGSLTETDKRLDSDGSLYDLYVLQGQGGQRIKIELKSRSFEPYLVLLDRDGSELISGSGTQDGQSARIEITLPYTGRYHIRVNSLKKNGLGRYALNIK
ncbi:MAG: PPC domain-containing protein [Acidobacteria bacterium]|nr:PPC domain-containing protein [Acidobacteriota bacterium]